MIKTKEVLLPFDPTLPQILENHGKFLFGVRLYVLPSIGLAVSTEGVLGIVIVFWIV